MNSYEISITLNLLISQVDELSVLIDMPRLHQDYEQWYSKSIKIIYELLPERLQSFKSAYSQITNYLLTHPIQPGVSSRRVFLSSLQKQKGILLSVKNDILTENCKNNAEEFIELICQKFYKVAKQLEHRHNNRPSIYINDEYDVQYLFYALLSIYFNDIRSEEWSPSYAGGNSRIDFLIFNEEIIIEIKKTRNQLKDKEIGEQLIIDIARYKAHPRCKKMICFIYDPDDLMRNPTGLQNDLACNNKDFSVSIIVSPTR